MNGKHETTASQDIEAKCKLMCPSYFKINFTVPYQSFCLSNKEPYAIIFINQLHLPCS